MHRYKFIAGKQAVKCALNDNRLGLHCSVLEALNIQGRIVSVMRVNRLRLTSIQFRTFGKRHRQGGAVGEFQLTA